MKGPLPDSGRDYTGLRYGESSTIELRHILKKHLLISCKRGFLIFCTIDIWGRIIICCERLCCVFSIRPDLYLLDASSTNIYHTRPSKKCLQILPNIPWKAKSPLIENYFSKQRKVTILTSYIN